MSHTLVATLMKAKTGSPISKLILLKLADNADVHGRCFPSYQYLALYCEVSLRTVKEHIKRLEEQGFLELVHRFDKRGRQRSNLYQLYTPAHLHVELGDERTVDEANASPSPRAAAAPRISQLKSNKEGYRQAAPPLRAVDKLVKEYHAKGQTHPFEERIQGLIKARKRSRADEYANERKKGEEAS
ncbi:helix-turn-helix domain-containing protein [Vibrio cholerae]